MHHPTLSFVLFGNAIVISRAKTLLIMSGCSCLIFKRVAFDEDLPDLLSQEYSVEADSRRKRTVKDASSNWL